MKNCIILGSGRSGTSMVAASLASTGYYLGGELIPPSPGNPRGFFEAREINNINETLLGHVLPPRPRNPLGFFFTHRPRFGQRWASYLPADVLVTCPEKVATRIQAKLRQTPFCFKDPRFSYTLPAWRPYLVNSAYVCVFREPDLTANSIMDECRRHPYMQDLRLNRRHAFRIWESMYRHILGFCQPDKDWLFIHYRQFLVPEGQARLEDHLGVTIDNAVIDPSTSRARPGGSIPAGAQAVYRDLCAKAGFHPN